MEEYAPLMRSRPSAKIFSENLVSFICSSCQIFLICHAKKKIHYLKSLPTSSIACRQDVFNELHSHLFTPQPIASIHSAVADTNGIKMRMINKLAASCSEHNPHFVLMPLFAQGHIIPIIDLARLLAARGVVVSVVTTPRNTTRLKTDIDQANASGLLIRLAELRFPCAEAGLPEGCENIDLLPNREFTLKFFDALNLLREPLLEHLRSVWPRPSCLVSDWCVPWTRDVAHVLGVPRFVFHGPSCFYLLASRNASKQDKFDLAADDAFEPFVLQDFPHEIEVVRPQAMRFFDYPGCEKLLEEALDAEATADGLVINSFRELEAPYLDSYQKAVGRNMWAVGPVCLSRSDADDKVARGNKAIVDNKYISDWLEARDPASVIYVSFGSISRHSTNHLFEIGHGLEASGKSFIWVVKQTDNSPELETWLIGELEERTRGRGLVLRGWVPQMLILSHPAVGGFMTHCGWNSTLESVSAGVPMITWPHFADQFLNEKLVVKVLRIGVALKPLMKTVYVGLESEGLINREDVEKAIVKLMDEGEEMRERAKELAKKANKAMEERGSSYESLTSLIQHAMELANKGCDAAGELCPLANEVCV